jgi:hypothetical protein
LTAAEIAALFADKNERGELERTILRHMEAHIKIECEACALLLEERARAAEQTWIDHKGDDITTKRELAGYARAMKDATFAIRNRMG